MLPDLSAIFYLAMFGLFCAGVSIIGGIGALIWFAVTHVQIV